MLCLLGLPCHLSSINRSSVRSAPTVNGYELWYHLYSANQAQFPREGVEHQINYRIYSLIRLNAPQRVV